MNLINFPLEFFKSNRERLRQKVSSDIPMVIVANGILQRGADSSYPFIQDANFWYLTGINDPDIILVMEEDREYLIVPIREGTRVSFDGQIDQESIAESCGITDIVNEVSGWKRLDAVLAKTRSLATLAPAPLFIEQYGMYSNPARARFIERVQKHINDLNLIDIRPELANLRMIKQPIEVQAIQTAIDITNKTLRDVIKQPAGTYKYEYQIEADISRGFRYLGAQNHAFEPIIAGGDRACTLHNISNSAALSPNELVVMDVGASVFGYAADITRMYCNGKPTDRQRDVFNAVSECQLYAIDLLKPGCKLKNYENKVMRFLGGKLKELKLINSIKEEEVRTFFPHATSHFLGLNVHDVGDYRQPLQPGTVLTVEPGIYIPKENIGVRIEDDILITDDGNKVLSKNLPSKLKLI